jgi:hypothetical protein
MLTTMTEEDVKRYWASFMIHRSRHGGQADEDSTLERGIRR